MADLKRSIINNNASLNGEEIKNNNLKNECDPSKRTRRRVLMRVAYDGTAYHGFQIQPEETTIEGELNRALSNVLGEDIEIIGASRTDAGVHALGNVAVFDTYSTIPAEKFPYAVNPVLPDDIIIQSSEECAPNFHPRKCDCRKTYEYTILNRDLPLPNYRNYTYHVYKKLDVDRMNRAAAFLRGRHDFKAMCSANTVTKTTVRTIYKASVTQEKLFEGGRLIKLSITGNGFLYNMVRIVTGTLIQAGTGAIRPEDIPAIIISKDRTKAGPTVPPQGLLLKEIIYK